MLIDGFSLRGDLGGGYSAHILLGFDRSGTVRWARERQGDVLWTHGDVVLTTRPSTPALERLSALDGELLSEERQPEGARWLAIAQAACDATCTTREMRVLFWRDRLDLAGLGVLEAPFGFTVVMLEDDVPRWHWSTPLDTAFDPFVVVPEEGIAPDGSLTLAIWGDSAVGAGPFCLADVPCADFPETLVVRLSSRGRPELATLVPPTRSLVLTDDGGFIISPAQGVMRFDASGARVWTNERLGDLVARIATDARTGELWAAIGIPQAPVELRGTTVAGCVHDVGYTVLVTMDPVSGAVVRTRGVFPGWVGAMEAHPDGGAVMEISPLGRLPSYALCGQTLHRDDDSSGQIEVVIAHIE